MTAIDVEKLLEPISDDAPCGEDLEYDPAFGNLERAAEGKPGHVMGDEEIPPEPPKWDEVQDAALALFERTKDLRIACHLTEASLHIDGLPGLAAGLQLINRLLQQYWDTVHPMLDAEDNDDPTFRVNSLMALNGRDRILGGVDRAILVSSRAMGRFSMRDVRLSRGEISLPESDTTPIPESAHIDAAFMDGDIDELNATSSSLDECIGSVASLETYIREQVGVENALEVDALKHELQAVRVLLNEQLERRGIAVEGADDDEEGEGAPAAGIAAASGEIRSREDAIRMIDRLCSYFEMHEPSSPVPLLLQRAKRLIAKDFMEILQDLTPDGVSQAKMIGGLDRDD